MPDPVARAFALDPAALAVGFSGVLRRAGVPVTPERTAWFAESLHLVPPRTRTSLYWSSRATLVSTQQQVGRFDAVFDAVFGGSTDVADRRGDPNVPDDTSLRRRTTPDPSQSGRTGGTAPSGPLPPAGADPGPSQTADDATEALLLAASPDERLHDTAFDALTPDEVARIRRLVAALVLRTPLRPGRRSRASARARDRLDLRRTVRAASRTGGQPARLVHAARRPRPRPIVLLCDISASMEPYTRVFVSFLQAAVTTGNAEAFVFATRLTRLTRHLSSRDADRALEQAAGAAQDWAGGTRLADGIRSFIDRHGRRGLARGAVVVILSDGWAQDDPDDIAWEMMRLRRLAHRIVWVNPRRAARGFEPLVGGMAAALPYCDAFVSGHSYTELENLVRIIADDTPPSRRKPDGSG
ncbi:MAG TPA: VWA domain-containing protein [Microbacterium sp.]|nr:VWA domain-containing protein [Microbacterium sp.]